MTNILITLLQLLGLYWKRDSWMSHNMDAQRKAYQARIKEIKRNG